MVLSVDIVKKFCQAKFYVDPMRSIHMELVENILVKYAASAPFTSIVWKTTSSHIWKVEEIKLLVHSVGSRS